MTVLRWQEQDEPAGDKQPKKKVYALHTNFQKESMMSNKQQMTAHNQMIFGFFLHGLGLFTSVLVHFGHTEVTD